MREGWEKALKAMAGIVMAAAGIVAARSGGESDEFAEQIRNATIDELRADYEQRRQQWVKDGYGGNGEKTPEMKLLDREISRRVAEERENDPRRNRDPNFRWTDANRWDKD